jgi:phosphoribosylanthranilate isomerase
MIRIKICGITNWTDARHAVDAGVHVLGFNFYAKSPRYIAPDDARRIAGRLPRRIQTAGVFVNTPAKDVLKLARAVDLNVLQLHGDESPASVGDLAHYYPVIKVFQVGPRFQPTTLDRYSEAEFFLLDGYSHNRRGGTGKTFNWSIARRSGQYGPIIVAGGLTPENVGAAIRAAHPFAVDVCGGVENSPGKKDRRRMEELVRAVGDASREME